MQNFSSFQYSQQQAHMPGAIDSTGIQLPPNLHPDMNAGLYGSLMGHTPIPTLRGWTNPPRALKRKPALNPYGPYCTYCNIQCNDGRAFQKHLESEKHKRHLNPPTVHRCEVCDITCTAFEHLEAHMKGAKHTKKLLQEERVKELINKTRVEVSAVAPVSQPEVESTETNIHVSPVTRCEGSLYFCKLCSMDCSSELQYQQHILGRKHKNRALSLKVRTMKAQIHHTNGVSCNFSSFQPCYLDENSNISVPDTANLLEAEKMLIHEFDSPDNFEIRLSCMYAAPPSLKIVRGVDVMPATPTTVGDSFLNASQSSNETSLVNFTKSNICTHPECVEKRARAFYSTWLEYQRNATHQLIEQKRRLREQRKAKKLKKEETSGNSNNEASTSSETENSLNTS